MELEAELRAYEEQLLQNAVRKNATAVASMLAADFEEFGSSGRAYSREEILAFMVEEAPIHVSLHEFKAQLIAAEVALVTYRTNKLEDNDRRTAALRSSLWVFRDGRWKIRFHQGTRVPVPAEEHGTITSKDEVEQ